MRESKKREHYWEGFRDALVHGARCIYMGMGDSERVAYQNGYDDGQRTEQRLVDIVNARIGGKSGGKNAK